jgi:hypothetical protein
MRHIFEFIHLQLTKIIHFSKNKSVLSISLLNSYIEEIRIPELLLIDTQWISQHESWKSKATIKCF